jgi:DNA-binding Lrp family transcriptional regulator
MIEKYPDVVSDYNILTTIVVYNFKRLLPLEKKRNPEVIIYGGDRTPISIDGLDKGLLSVISTDVRSSSVELGKKLGVTPKTVINRIKILEKKKILLGYRPFIDLDNYGYDMKKFMLRFHNISVDMENQLVNYCTIHPNVVNIVKTLGSWDMEIEIKTQNSKIFRTIEKEIRHRFSSLIQNIYTITIYETLKMNLYPQFINKYINNKTEKQ